jgi:predicted nucleotidyltransferase
MNFDPRKEAESRELFKKDLRALSPEVFAMRYMFENIPHIFDNVEQAVDWKVFLASKLRVDPFSIVLVGSACTGFSLNPDKNYRMFTGGSDIDVAIISNYHFEIGWRHLRELGALKYGLSASARSALKENQDTHFFWGAINTRDLLPHLPFGTSWLIALEEMGCRQPTRGRDIKVRIYRDSYSLVGYHVNNIRKRQKDLLTPL